MSSSSVCADHMKYHHHAAHQLYLSKKSLREIEIPPRKLLSRARAAAAAGSDISSITFMDSPKLAEDAVFSKFLPYNSVNDDDDSDPYSSDHFRMYEFKVRKCNRSRSHDWTDCPFAHPGEKARRRDPRRFHYAGTVCPEFRKGHCAKGDNCEFSHGVFECWLHPDRYRTEACKDGKSCKRKVCFFAHSTRQLRYLPADPSSPPPLEENKYRRCCAFCHSSPTSTLMSMARVSPPASPPQLSPYVESFGNGGGVSYKDALAELMNSMEAMKVGGGEGTAAPVPIMSHASAVTRPPWVDVNFGGVVDEQPQFVMSPSPGSSKFSPGGSSSRFQHRGEFSGRNLMEDSRFNNESGGVSGQGPDLGWVNDLLT